MLLLNTPFFYIEIQGEWSLKLNVLIFEISASILFTNVPVFFFFFFQF